MPCEVQCIWPLRLGNYQAERSHRSATEKPRQTSLDRIGSASRLREYKRPVVDSLFLESTSQAAYVVRARGNAASIPAEGAKVPGLSSAAEPATSTGSRKAQEQLKCIEL